MNLSLRPNSFDQYFGQKNILKTLKLFIKGVKRRGPQEHILLYGPSGIGKTTLAYVIAQELGVEIKITSGVALTKAGDLASILTNLKEKSVLFIDEIHRLPKTVEETLYPVLEEFFLDIVIGKGPSARIMRLSIPKIVVIGATTKIAMLSQPLRNRFGLILRLDYYKPEELKEIILKNAKTLDLPLTEQMALEIAKRSRGVPRIANHILRRVLDFYQEHKSLKLSDLYTLFSILGIDNLGLNEFDKKYLETLVYKFNNQPIGLETLASILNEDKKTIEDFVEPYLIQTALIKKTPRGRVATSKGIDHLKNIRKCYNT